MASQDSPMVSPGKRTRATVQEPPKKKGDFNGARKWWFNGGLMGFNHEKWWLMGFTLWLCHYIAISMVINRQTKKKCAIHGKYPLVICYIAIENGL